MGTNMCPENHQSIYRIDQQANNKIDDFGEHDVIMVDDPNACKTGSSSVLTEHNNNNPASSSCDVQSSNVATKQLLPPPPNDRVKSTPAINKSVKPSSDQHHPRQIGNPSKPSPRRPIMSSALTDLIAAKSIDGASKKSVSSSTNATTSNGSGNDDLPLDLTLCSRLSPPPPKRHASSNGRISNTSSSSVSSTVNSGLLPTTATTSTKPQNQPGIDEITQWVTEAVANFYHHHHQQQIALVRSTFVPNHPSWHSCPHAVQLANPNICNQFKQPIPVTPTTLCQLMTSPQGQLIHNIQSTSGQQPQLYAVDASGSANQPALPPIHFQQHPIIIPTIPLPPNQPGNTALQASYLTHPHLAFSTSQPLVLTDNQLMPPPTVFHHTTNHSMLMVNGNQLLSPSPAPTVTTNSLSGQVNQLTQQPTANLMTLNSATTLIGQPSSSSHSTNNGSGESSSSTPRYALF